MPTLIENIDQFNHYFHQLDFLSANDYVADDGTLIDRKLNVAMTRARRRLVIVGHAPLLSRDPVFRRLIDYCKAQGTFLTLTATDAARARVPQSDLSDLSD